MRHGFAYRAVAPFPKKLLAFRGPHRAEARTHFYKKKGMIIIANRKRNVTLSIRLTAKEKEAILSKANEAEMSVTDYIVRSTSRKKIRVVNMKDVVIELKRIGNNINQIAWRINSGELRSYNFDSVVREQRKIYDILLSIKGSD